jgi:hypothetical protein
MTSLSLPPPLVKPFCLSTPIRDMLHHRPHLPVDVCQATGLLLLSPCSQLPASTHSCGNVAEHLKMLRTTLKNKDTPLPAANLRNDPLLV